MPLYHYTDAQAVQSMLTTKKLWLTDIRFLNDASELIEGIGYFRKALETPLHGLFSDHRYAKDSIEYLLAAFNDQVSFGIEEEPIFTCSFSKSKDLLSQWRAYGSYAIEFDEELLSECIGRLKKCIYEPLKKSGLARTAITNALAMISKDMGNNEGRASLVSLDPLVSIVNAAASFKNEGFREEMEMRVIRTVPDGGEAIHYRQKENRLIPYLEVDISLDCIKSICVGPMAEQDLAHKSMSMFVRSVEKDWQLKSSNIEYELSVTKSPIPLRKR